MEPTQYHLHTQTWSQNLIPSYFCVLIFFLIVFPTTYDSIISMFFKYVLLPMILTSSNTPFNAWVSIFAWYGSPSYYGFYVIFKTLYSYFSLFYSIYMFLCLWCLILHIYIFCVICLCLFDWYHYAYVIVCF